MHRVLSSLVAETSTSIERDGELLDRVVVYTHALNRDAHWRSIGVRLGLCIGCSGGSQPPQVHGRRSYLEQTQVMAVATSGPSPSSGVGCSRLQPTHRLKPTTRQGTAPTSRVAFCHQTHRGACQPCILLETPLLDFRALWSETSPAEARYGCGRRSPVYSVQVRLRRRRIMQYHM